MKGFINILIVLVFILSILPVTLVSADPPIAPPGKLIRIEKLNPGEVRLSQNAKARFIREVPPGQAKDEDVKYLEYTVEISSLPKVMPDLQTEIICEWRRGQAVDGVPYFENGNNLYWAKVTGTRVSVEYKGFLAAWDPDVFVGETELKKTSGPRVIVDPKNPFYSGNTIKWVYKGKVGGILGIGSRQVTITRYLRQIEGSLIEYYVLEEDPGYDVKIVNNYVYEEGFSWNKEVFAHDANYNPIKIEGGKYEKIVSEEELGRKDIEYPIVIDPTLPFTSLSADGFLYEQGDGATAQIAWDSGHDASEADSCYDSSSDLLVGVAYLPYTTFKFYRGYLYLDTSSLTADADISDAILKVYVEWETGSPGVQIQDGTPTYPHSALEKGDYDYTHYSGNGGRLYSLTEGQYNSITLTSPGEDWINQTGTTKFCIRALGDVNDEISSSTHWVNFYSSEGGSTREPKLLITYTLPAYQPVIETRTASNVEETSALLRGRLLDDGGMDCSVRFLFGPTDGYGAQGSPTVLQDGFSSWESFDSGDEPNNLSPGTLYHYTAQADNDAVGHSEPDDETFLTKPQAPTNLECTPGDGENDLTWTKGAGSSKTYIRFKTTGFPDSLTDGTQIYFDTLSSYNHPDLDNGTTYYYRAWAYAAGGGFEEDSDLYDEITGMPTHTGTPGVTTNPAISVKETTATFSGYLDDLAGSADADCFFQYKEEGEAWTPTDSEELNAVGNFTRPITGLTTDTLYHMRAAATNDTDTGYGDDIPFTTNAVCAPTMTTDEATGETRTSAIIWGTVADWGGAEVTGWFEWGKTPICGNETDDTYWINLETDDRLHELLSPLSTNTTYYFRVIGENIEGNPSPGDTRTFSTTAPTLPAVTTNDESNLGATSAILHGTLDADGGVPCEVQFQYSGSGNFTGEETDTEWQPSKVSGESFQHPVSGLSTGTKYYFRAQAKNNGEIASGGTKDFTTVFGAPQDFIATPLSKDTISLSWERAGDQTSIRGKVGAFPADRLDGDSVYKGIAEGVGHSDLLPGTTYFYRAWSWREGDVYSDTYAEDAATTLAGIIPTTPEVPQVVGEMPEAPESWWQPGSGDKFADWPFLAGAVDRAAEGTEMPVDTIWLLLGVLAIVIVGVGASASTGNLAFAVVSVIVGIAIAAWLGLIPFWILLLFIVLGLIPILISRRV